MWGTGRKETEQSTAKQERNWFAQLLETLEVHWSDRGKRNEQKEEEAGIKKDQSKRKRRSTKTERRGGNLKWSETQFISSHPGFGCPIDSLPISFLCLRFLTSV